MKKLTAFLFLNFVLLSCTTENELIHQDSSTFVSKLTKRSLTEALEIAKEATSLFESQTRSHEHRTIDLKNIQYLCLDVKSRNQDSDTLLYIINYADNNGFAVVSANPNTIGLIAVTEKGSYNPTFEEINNKTGIGLYMNMAEMYVSNSGNEIQNTGPVPILEFMERVDTIDTYILPKLTTKWGQLIPEGRFCPNLYSGCVNTALAQIMAYFEYPTQISVTYDNANNSLLNLDWSEMKKCKGLFNETATDVAQIAIGYLCRQLGYLTGSEYEIGITKTTLNSALSAARGLGYTVSSNVSNYGDNVSFRTVLDNNNLILMGGFKSGETYGHAWVVDGHLEREFHYTAYTRAPNSELWQLYDEHSTYYNYNHINWGDDGYCNGYFLEDVFDKSDAYLYDGTANTLLGNYTENLKYFLITK